MISHERGVYLATTYSHRTCRPTTIGAEAFHFRVRNGTGWFHLALVTRGQRWVDGVSCQRWDSGYIEPCFSSSVFLSVCRRSPLAGIRSLTSAWSLLIWFDPLVSTDPPWRSIAIPIPKTGIKPNG